MTRRGINQWLNLSFAWGLAVVGIASAPAATPPMLSSFPEVNAPTLVADDATPYTVTMTATDKDGSNDIRCVRVLFNYTEAGGIEPQGRGYMNWGKTDADVTQWGGNWVVADAAGGGRWAYHADTWGGVMHITPLACETSVSGSASGREGSRTVTWTFTVKSAWAFNPVMNDADGWVADGVIGGTSYIVGWMDGQVPFDVVAAPCSLVCATPRPPVVSNPTATSVDAAVHPADSASDVYAIMVSPSVGGRMFVQVDGTLGRAPQWRARAQWGAITVTGLLPDTLYTFHARASRSQAGYCPSAWSNGVEIMTGRWMATIEPYQGTGFSPWVRGQCPYRSIPAGAWEPLWDLTIGSMARGVAGGLDADCYDWRDIDSGSGWGTPAWSGRFTTLESLLYARDHGAAPMITANMFGGGYRDWEDIARPGVFVCQTVNPDGLAADWVRYTNIILQDYRQGDEAGLTGENQRVYESIVNFGGKPKLLAPGEASVPRVQYWEIGNEPELGGYGDFLTKHYLGPADYRDRYKLISAAMLAVDPTLKFGPCLINPADPNSQWLPVLAADPDAPIDFVSYHPYYSAIKSNWGYLDGITGALRDCRQFLNDRSAAIRSILQQHGRTGVDLVASEWNAVNWDAPGYMQSSMAGALGVAETCFTFAEDGVLAGTFWEQPQNKLGPKGVFTGLVEHMGDVLVATGTDLGYDPANINFRIYVTQHSDDDSTLMIWGLNFDDAQPMTVSLSLAPCRILSARRKHFGKPGSDDQGGDTSLTDSSGLAWDEQSVPMPLDSADFAFTMEDAEITLLILEIAATTPADIDRDGDVDQADFGWFQSCLSGPTIAQPAEHCRFAMLDGDDDVDQMDVALFMGCLSGADVPADPACGR